MDYTDGLQGGVLPLGLAFGMAMDERAIDHYGRMTEYEGILLPLSFLNKKRKICEITL